MALWAFIVPIRGPENWVGGPILVQLSSVDAVAVYTLSGVPIYRKHVNRITFYGEARLVDLADSIFVR